jgi:hypothetical protein
MDGEPNGAVFNRKYLTCLLGKAVIVNYKKAVSLTPTRVECIPTSSYLPTF